MAEDEDEGSRANEDRVEQGEDVFANDGAQRTRGLLPNEVRLAGFDACENLGLA